MLYLKNSNSCLLISLLHFIISVFEIINMYL